jgi:hypothetical protein
MSADDDYAELRSDLGSQGGPRYREAKPPSRWPKVEAWQILLGGFLLASVTTWTWGTIVVSWLLRGGQTCTPNPRFEAPPKYGCDTDVPPYFVLVVITVASFAWLVWTSWTFLKGGPSGRGFFALRAFQERGEILYYALIGGSLLALLLLYGWGICWGPGGLVGQVLIGTPKYLVGGGDRYPALILAAKLPIVFFGSVKLIGSISIDTQGS